MKLIISPSKTKKINNLPIKDDSFLIEKEPVYLEITKEIIKKIKTFSRTGFIGGCSGRIGDTFIFNGDVSQHPDFALMLDFVESKGLTAKWFPEYQLTDIGSIL